MSVLRIGYALFKGASQAGVIGDKTPGNIEVETNEAKDYRVQVQRLSDNFYWNNTTKAFQAGDPTVDDIKLTSTTDFSPRNCIRLTLKPSLDMCAAITSAGALFSVYPTDDVAANGASIRIDQALN